MATSTLPQLPPSQMQSSRAEPVKDLMPPLGDFGSRAVQNGLSERNGVAERKFYASRTARAYHTSRTQLNDSNVMSRTIPVKVRTKQPDMHSPYENLYDRALTAREVTSPIKNAFKRNNKMELEFELFRQSIEERRREVAAAKRLRQMEAHRQHMLQQQQQLEEEAQAEIERRKRVHNKIMRHRAKLEQEQKERERQAEEEEKRRRQARAEGEQERQGFVREQQRRHAQMIQQQRESDKGALRELRQYEEDIARRTKQLEQFIRTQREDGQAKQTARRHQTTLRVEHRIPRRVDRKGDFFLTSLDNDNQIENVNGSDGLEELIPLVDPISCEAIELARTVVDQAIIDSQR